MTNAFNQFGAGDLFSVGIDIYFIINNIETKLKN